MMKSRAQWSSSHLPLKPSIDRPIDLITSVTSVTTSQVYPLALSRLSQALHEVYHYMVKLKFTTAVALTSSIIVGQSAYAQVSTNKANETTTANSALVESQSIPTNLESDGQPNDQNRRDNDSNAQTIDNVKNNNADSEQPTTSQPQPSDNKRPTTKAKTNKTTLTNNNADTNNISRDNSGDNQATAPASVHSAKSNSTNVVPDDPTLAADSYISPSTPDVTASPTMSTVAPPIPQANSARTRGNNLPNPIQQAGLERLKTFYQPKTTISDQASNHNDGIANNLTTTHNRLDAPICSGNWVYPSSTFQQQAALAAAETNQPDSAFPLQAEADYGYYDNKNYAELAGNVQINQGRQQISADKVVVNLQDGIAAAQGNVLLLDAAQLKRPEQPASIRNTQGGLITVANEVAYQTDSSKATAKDVAFASVPLQAHGYAKQLNKVDESRYEVSDAMFTTCAPDNPTWQINAKNIDINTESGRGQVRNATFKFKNRSVLYLPYFNFPIDARRSSGFLLPRTGFSSDNGLTVQVPYYFNLAPNYDATLTPSIYTNRNPMLTGEFRYLTDGYGQGDLNASYLPNDRQYHDEDRSSIFFNHHWRSSDNPRLSADAIYQYVSDSAYLSDFDLLGSKSSQLNLPRRIQANYYDENTTALAKFETFQTLDSDLTDDQKVADKDKPYYRLPQLSVSYKLPWIKQLDVSGISDFAYFKRPIHDNSAPEQSGGRLYNKLTAAYPIKRTWGYLTPAVSLQHLYTQYDQTSVEAGHYDKNNKSQSIFVPEYSLDAGLNFYKAGTPFSKFDDTLGGYQLISPRLKYVYSPYKDQSQVPNFNTRLASLNLPQLYENSWFLGYDRLPDNNHLTPSVNYRFIDASGLTRLDASIGKQYYFDDIKVRLDNNSTPIKLDSSGTVLQISSQPRQNFWVDLDGAVTNNGNLDYYNAQFRYLPTSRSLYNVGLIKRNANAFGQRDLSAITASAIFPIKDNWRFLGALQYDSERNRYSDVLAGVTYDSCCYAFSVYGRSYYDELNDTGKAKRAIMAEISLNGIINKREGRLSSLISNRVLGYNQLSDY